MVLQRPFVSMSLLLLLAASVPHRCAAQQADAPKAGTTADSSLADTVKQLQEQVNELRSVVSELRSESERYRSETERLREELHSAVLQRPQSSQNTREAAPPAPSPGQGGGPTPETSDAQSRLSKLEEQYDLLSGKVDDQYQTKVESASKYRLRLSGLVLLNLFTNRGAVDSADLPGVVDAPDALGRSNSTGLTLRQSLVGLEVFGPQVGGAKSRGQVQFDFAGGFPSTPNGTTFGLMRLRTGTLHLDWQHTSVVAGQDTLFFSPLSPTSFATVAEPAFAYAGNLWTWTPQIRVEHRVSTSENSTFTLQAGILDALTGEPPATPYTHTPGAGEFSRQPAYASRAAWSHTFFGQEMSFGAGGYYSRQNWGFNRNIDAWAGTADWAIPLGSRLGVSGEFYRGRALGGLGGGLYHSAIFNGYPSDPRTQIRGLDSIGGWSQLKFRASSKLEFNAAAGQDNPYAGELRTFPYSPYTSGVLSRALTRNQSELFNFIYRPRSDLLFSAEYRHIATYELDNSRYTADRIDLIMGILF
jgi:regulator of replication initiation timing